MTFRLFFGDFAPWHVPDQDLSVKLNNLVWIALNEDVLFYRRLLKVLSSGWVCDTPVFGGDVPRCIAKF